MTSGPLAGIIPAENIWSTLGRYAQTLPLAIFGLDRRLVIRVANSRACRLVLERDDGLTGQPMARVCSRFDETQSRLLSSASAPVRLDAKLRTASGRPLPVRLTAVPLRGRSRIIGCVIVAEDMRSRRQTERERLTTKRALIRLDGIHVYLFDADRRIIFCNRLPEQAVGMSLDAAARFARRQGLETGVLTHLKYLLDHPEAPTSEPLEIGGRRQRFHIESFPPEGGLEGGVAVMVYDVTEEARLREELRRREQLTMIGSLANNTAHELRNPLSAIRAMAQLGERLSDSAAKDRTFQRILAEVDRLDQYIDDLLLLPKTLRDDLAPVDLIELLEEVLVLVHGDLIAHRIEVVRDFAQELPPVEGERRTLRRALLNLMANAVEAMRDGGTLTLRAEHHSAPQNAYVRLVIAGSGDGFHPDALERIFSPVSPGATSEGSLALAVAHQVITQQHRGRLRLYGSPDVGSAVAIELAVYNAPERN